MPVRLGPAAADTLVGPSPRWTCAFVNNMPDGAFDATERQFLQLLDSASGEDIIDVTRHTMEGVPRGENTAGRIAREYGPVGDVYLNTPNLLVVTGSNPIEMNIDDEPYWDELVQLLTWGRTNVRSMLLSCLSAHAALKIFDSRPRARLPFKCTGVFIQQVDVSDLLGEGIEPEIELPHSRTNTVPREDLEDAGYRVVIQSNEVGWGVARKLIDSCEVVLVQGHPEYDPSSLLREYRRDAGRYVSQERDDPPVLPFHCASLEDWTELARIHELITSGTRDPALLEQYHFDEVAARAPWPWRPMAQRLYANWLTSVK